MRWETRGIWVTAFVPLSYLTRYRICAPPDFGAGRVNAFCTTASRPSPNRLIAAYSYSPLSTSVTVPSLMYRARLCGALNRSRTLLAPQDVLSALVLDQAGLMPSLKPQGSGLPS
ncbi:hypothetical protein GCM10018980_72120 [Streptomyces capoamus]|uniref:Uncharacterized protein n=1 Tax=Streptomyces capoamus TaxID=68183 RepID=A0A919KFM5_9ACTN|nr:hypothetical protein GCM10018980_72120 [Streptomyces capoamus]